jgi:hypothetical protein
MAQSHTSGRTTFQGEGQHSKKIHVSRCGDSIVAEYGKGDPINRRITEIDSADAVELATAISQIFAVDNPSAPNPPIKKFIDSVMEGQRLATSVIVEPSSMATPQPLTC